MATQDLGRLEYVDVRAIWPNEAHDFTPWLLQNADRLADALGIELALHRAEHPVGDFSLDLIGRDLTNDCELIVENQLGLTDHGHLGQLMTYAAGTKAQTIVWIAPAFREEHREALRWLNDIAGDQARFFGVEVRVVRIGASSPAPLFALRAEPNEWGATVSRETRSPSEKELQYQAYWERFLEEARRRQPNWRVGRGKGRYPWYLFPSAFRHCRWALSFVAGDQLMAELYIDAGDEQQNLAILERFKESRAAIERAFGDALEWQDLPTKRACRICYHGEGTIADVERYPVFIDWMLDVHARMRAAFESVDIDLSDIS